jgi:hypothetical protein
MPARATRFASVLLPSKAGRNERTKLKRLIRATSSMLLHGRPRVLTFHGIAPGDDMLCTCVLREMRKREMPRPWMASNHPELFVGNDDVQRVVPMSAMVPRVAQKLGVHVIDLGYYWPPDDKADYPKPHEHLLLAMCRRAGLRGNVLLRPYLHLSDEERSKGKLAERQIAIMSTAAGARLPAENKQWPVERFQRVVDVLSLDHQVVQLGATGDPPLRSTLDLRGRTTMRQAAAILSQSLCFIGLEGFLMHLARAVECRSVIVFGGRSTPEITGYPCNANHFTPLPCSPCFLWSKCDFARECMTRISAPTVIESALNLMARHGSELEVIQAVIAPQA